MSLKKVDFEKAVETLLCPRYYEYMLFVQSQIEKSPRHRGFTKYRQIKDVIRMVRADNPSVRALNMDDALDVLREAVRRLK